MKNIILLITDTFRYDNLFDRAERPVRTPGLDRFITETATEVTGFYSGSFPTIPHRTDLTSGTLGWPHYGWQVLQDSTPNHLPALLGEQGYLSQLICDCPHLFGAGFNSGFNAAVHNRGQEGDTYWLHLNDAVTRVMPAEKTRAVYHVLGDTLVDLHRWTNRYYTSESETFAAKTGTLATKWVEENYKSDRPFFLWVDFFDPHEPWDPPEDMVKRYDPDYEGIPMIHPNYGRSDVYTDAELHNLWAHYAAEAELVDKWLGRVLQKIEETGLLEDSIVVITSDHGFSVGDHERAGKSNLSEEDERYWPLYPEINHVPFLLAGSDIPKGSRLDLTAQPIDIMPTLCELAGAKVDPEQPVEGRSFAGAVLEGKGAHRNFAVTGQFLPLSSGSVDRVVTPFVTSGGWGYAPIGAAGEPELYDLSADPFTKTDVAAGNAEKTAELHGLLVEHLGEHNAAEELVRAWEERG